MSCCARSAPIARAIRSALTFGLLVVALAPVLAQAQTISLNQKRIRIEALVKRVGEATERTILVPDTVRGTVSIVAKRPVSLTEAWSILESSLSLLGFSLLPSTVENWRIATVAEAAGEAPFQPNAGTDSESFVTTLIPLRSADLTDVLKVIEPLSGSRVTLVPFEATNSLIASGSERAIARLTSLVDELDHIEEESLRLRVLRYRDVAQVEPFVEGFLESGGGEDRGIQVWSDARTNSLAVRGEPEGVARVLRFLDQIDEPIEGAGSIRILRVLHRDPDEVAELIRSFADPIEGATSEAVPSATSLSGADFSIAVDGRSRSLLIRAAPEVHFAIREALEILDRRSELIAVDITVSELRTPVNYGLAFGFQLPFSSGNDPGDLFGLVDTTVALSGLQGVPTVFGSVQRDSGVSFQTTGSTGGAVTVPILQSATVAALDFEGTNEVLIQPSLIVAAGEEHEIFAGLNIPIPVTESSGITDQNVAGLSVASISRTTSFERQDIGTRLGIEVRAGREGKIQLDLEIELSTLDPTRAALAGDPTEVGPAFVERSLSVRARLDDGESAVLAMDRKQKQTRIESGVPFLRDLPGIGWLFRAKGALIEDVHLVIAARARRVSNPSELVADTIRRRIAFERMNAREATRPAAEGSPYGVRVTTRRREDDAKAIADSLALRGLATAIHRWSISGKEYFDVYVTGLDSMVDAAEVAEGLWNEGWQTDLVVFSARS
ncbi:MAG: hypothetical protein CL933_12740 [Deltaproteobacteria bacterium]|nr:hypothetical protein [Deltaproteobacteria bacterium]